MNKQQLLIKWQKPNIIPLPYKHPNNYDSYGQGYVMAVLDLLEDVKKLCEVGDETLARNDYLMNELDRKFAHYYEYNKEIAIRKEEMKMREADENIGGGKSNIMSNPIESQVIKELSDPYIANRELWKVSIKDTLEEQSKDIQNLMYSKYWGEDSWMDWVSFGKKHGYSRNTIYRIRQKVLLDFGRRIGEVN
ncbi:hypothetical protein [Enterococcus sp. AZ072]|uniref:hypothetical protein n=1 Tax=unclassified Enterococcus TaxID=2608891 RepID=UPI003D2A692A